MYAAPESLELLWQKEKDKQERDKFLNTSYEQLVKGVTQGRFREWDLLEWVENSPVSRKQNLTDPTRS